MSYFAGLASGMQGAFESQREEAFRRDQQQQAKEGQILQLLAEHGTPELQAMAFTGLLQSAQPRKKKGGLSGFLGEMEGNPVMARIQQFIGTPETVTRQVPTPDFESAATPMRPQAAALPADAMTDPEATAGPLRYAATPPPMTTETMTRPRQVLLTPEERYAQQERGQARGRLSGMRAEMTEAGIPADQQQEAILRNVGGRYGLAGARGAGTPTTYGEGDVVPDPESPTGFSRIMYDRRNPTQQMRMAAPDPKTAGAARPYNIRYGTAVEERAKRLFGKTYAELDADQAEAVYQSVRAENPEAAAEIATARSRATGDQAIVTKGAMPISVTEAQSVQAPVGSTINDLRGVTPPTDQQVKAAGAAERLKPVLAQINDLAGQVLPGKDELGGLAGLAPGVIIAKRRLDPAYREQFAALDSAVSLAQGMVRQMQGQSGAETEKDAQRALKALANAESGFLKGDTKESQAARMAIVERFLAAAEANIQKKRAAAPPPGAASAAGKVATRAQITAYAAAKQKDPAAVEQELRNAGYTIQ
jgi:hypothetical protein